MKSTQSDNLKRSSLPEYKVWCSMRDRCRSPKNPNWHRYGGRGISVCERWQSFDNFYADMGKRPDGTTLDRIDNAGNYEPSNCRWATRKKQANNTRRNVLITYEDKTQTMAEWANELGLTYQTLDSRLHQRGWSPERAFTTPLMPSNRWGTK